MHGVKTVEVVQKSMILSAKSMKSNTNMLSFKIVAVQ